MKKRPSNELPGLRENRRQPPEGEDCLPCTEDPSTSTDHQVETHARAASESGELVEMNNITVTSQAQEASSDHSVSNSADVRPLVDIPVIVTHGDHVELEQVELTFHPQEAQPDPVENNL